MSRFIRAIFSINPVTLTIGITFLVMILFITGVPILDLVELKTYDLRFLSRGLEKASLEIVLAVIDEKSLDMEGRWPWPRSKLARLIDILSKDGAKVVTLDILFSEPDQNASLGFIKEFEKKSETSI